MLKTRLYILLILVFAFCAKKKVEPVCCIGESISFQYRNPAISFLTQKSTKTSKIPKNETLNPYSVQKGFPFVNYEESSRGIKTSRKLMKLLPGEKSGFQLSGKFNHILQINPKVGSEGFPTAFVNGKEEKSGNILSSRSSRGLEFSFENREKTEIFFSAKLIPAQQPKFKPDVIFIVIDSLRYDALGSSGSNYNASPFLDQFAKTSVTYKKHFVNSSWTRPSTMIFFLGMYPSRTFINFWDYPVYPGEKEAFYNSYYRPLPAILGATGYESVMIGSNPFLTDHRYLGVDMGFEKSVDYTFAFNETYEIHKETVAFLNSRNKKNPLFLFINFNDPHRPYEPPEKYLNQVKNADQGDSRKKLYLGEVAYVDDMLGDIFGLLKKMGKYDDSLIIVTADHGEVMNPKHAKSVFTGVYTLFGHGQDLYEESIHVPLLIKYPIGVNVGKHEVNSTTRSIDLFPTVLDVAEIPHEWTADGKTLLPEIFEKEDTERSYYGEGRGVVGYREGNHKLLKKTHLFHRPGFSWNGIVEDEPEFLYDLAIDPEEISPVRNSILTEKMRSKIMHLLPKSTRHFIRFTNPVSSQRIRKFNANIGTKIGQIKILQSKIVNATKKGKNISIDLEIPPGKFSEIEFEVYPDATSPEISFFLDGAIAGKGKLGVGGYDLFPENCRSDHFVCQELFLSKSDKPQIPTDTRIQYWRTSGHSHEYKQNDRILEKESMDILKKQGYVQ